MSTPSAPDQIQRNRLIETHIEFANGIASKVRRELSANVELDELRGYAYKGLVEAAGRYDPAHRVAFKTFAYYRVRGAIFDGLRQVGWLSRGAYARFQAASNELLGNVAERARPSRPGAALGDLAQTLDQLATVFVTTASAERLAEIPDQAGLASEAVESQQQRETVRRAVATLPERERQLIELYYFGDHSLTSAGAELGLSKSWASRLHSRAIKLLTAALERIEAQG